MFSNKNCCQFGVIFVEFKSLQRYSIAAIKYTIEAIEYLWVFQGLLIEISDELLVSH